MEFYHNGGHKQLYDKNHLYLFPVLFQIYETQCIYVSNTFNVAVKERIQL
jgi:hypothetical protein